MDNAAEASYHILVVDDDEDDHFLIEDEIKGVEGAKYTIDAALSPAEAFELIESTPYDVILCDYRMGGATGVDFIRELRAKGKDIPVILLTGVANRSVDLEGLEAGASDFITKVSMTGAIIDRAVRYSIANLSRQRLLQAVLRSSGSGVVVINADSSISYQNNQYVEFSKSVGHGADTNGLVAFARTLIDSTSSDVEIGSFVFERHVSDLPNGERIVVIHDVSDRVRALRERESAKKRILHMALHDDLTGLPNRTAFNTRFDDSVAEAGSRGHALAVLSFDLNKFKQINDIYGHAVGDCLLKMVSERVMQCAETDDFVARLGGDEFVAIQKVGMGETGAPRLAQRIAKALANPFMIQDQLVSIDVSIGVVHYPDHGLRRDELLANADAAMYRAKASPNQRICIYDLSMDRMIRDQRAIGNGLKEALALGELELHYQPQACVRTGQINGFEALARWNSPKFGQVSPSTFVPVAEESGLILNLGEWALFEACRTAARWSDPKKVAVNVSPIQLAHSDLPAIVRAALKDSGLSPSLLEIEVTEATLIEDEDRALSVLRDLKGLGLTVAMDDFGTGYSSLSALQTFPVDKIKIDRSFVEKVINNDQASAIVRSIVGLGKTLEIPVLAEGVETREHVDYLKREGCAEMQGFLIGRPARRDGSASVRPDDAEVKAHAA